jgi:acyl-[acyl-carrier-protein]-phospholipid O-acyltransferase/long-chain-fatty-acid--[acyl-carrier-protein] ligase
MDHLFKTRRFLPIFITQFLGAVNDHLFKNAFVMLVTFKLSKEHGWETSMVVNAITALLIGPMILFSAVSGEFADRLEKSRLIRLSKLAEIAIMIIAAFGLAVESPAILFASVFLTGLQITFFGPLKYGILPCHLKKEELMDGAAIFEGATFLAILLGTILGGFALSESAGAKSIHLWVLITLIVLAIGGWISSRFIPESKPEGEVPPADWNPWTSSLTLLREAREHPAVWQSMLGLSWFWAMGVVWMAYIPPFVADTLKAGPDVAMQLLVMFSIGIGTGSYISSRLLHGEISAKYAPLAGGGISICSVIFIVAESMASVEPFSILSVKGFLIAIALIGIGVCGGIFSVPLYAILQSKSEASHRARNIAANNVINSLFMVAASLVAIVMGKFGFGGVYVLGLMAILNLAVSWKIICLVPESVLHTFTRAALRILFRVDVVGLENYAAARGRKLIVANHVSFLDSTLIAAFLPELPTFAVDTVMAQKPLVKLVLGWIPFFPVDPMKPMAIKSLLKEVKQGTPVMIFPEGRLTLTGNLMKIYQGAGVIAMRAEADFIPVQIDGVERSYFSKLPTRAKRTLFPRMKVTIFPPVRIVRGPGNARQVREATVAQVYEIMSEMRLKTKPCYQTMMSALLKARKLHGADFEIVDDYHFKPKTYGEFVASVLTLAPHLNRGTKVGEAIGMMLPNQVTSLEVYFGFQAGHRVPAPLNYTSGSKNLVSACRTAQIRVVWTTERFIQEAKLQPVIETMKAEGIEIRFLEEIPAKSGFRDRIRYAWGLRFPGSLYRGERKRWQSQEGSEGHFADRPATILYTSGSSGAPKAVVLSHRNLLTNAHQLMARFDIHRQDRIFNCLPLFHSFGLTGGALTPILNGVPAFLYPSPLHYRIIPELVYQSNATLFFATNTFLNGYSRRAHAYDFYSVRAVFAGAEKVKESTKKTWMDQFGVRIYEGYGSTECSPGLAINTPFYSRPETVGKFLPGIEYRLEPVPGISEGGRLWVKGANIMRGYYLPENPGVLVPVKEGWYDTGDIAEVSVDGFVKIVGRAKRFAKVAGEMISLSAVEELALSTWPGVAHATLAVPHPTKGEEVILVTEKSEPQRVELLEQALKIGLSELFVPKTLISLKIPVLGSGKPDYVALAEMVKAT